MLSLRLGQVDLERRLLLQELFAQLLEPTLYLAQRGVGPLQLPCPQAPHGQWSSCEVGLHAK